MDESDDRNTPTSGMNPWRAGCGESRTSGSEGGPGKPTGRNLGRAPRSDPYTHFTRCKRHVYAIIDVVSRYWISWLSTTEQTTTQVQLLFTEALADQGLLGPDGEPLRHGTAEEPALIAWSDNGPEMTAGDTRAFMR